ncbi:hypothetical protein Pedsa_0083 [Pseudopedobacter saltans DSM 12145]|uniref:Transposase IS200-like domain-containing protein n=1 Tax=Pseudopedobacter saltans (strain ATCC 51119 / DSM 12145 / JCM 21818 / CCUG 39354 / LMG 10337 / NBRC 100064 / NCIMB 13643) TaxID=762903 RepID=F0SCT1_PSESL|nr:transposase [Pseudopedobacter saltans]ADY50670.1 hypothetical protein Pedsa_0083 [Pseudopedobacter saltans DSM 12145]
MSERGYLIKDQFAIHFITFSVIQWIDVFSRTNYADIVVESLKYCRANKGLRVHAWCIMSNHVHLIVSAVEPNRLSDILRDFKKFTSSNILKAISENNRESRKNWMLWIFRKAGERNSKNKDFQFWQQDNHPIQCENDKILETKLQYLHENPVRANIVRREQDYVYSSGIDYYTADKGLIELDML